MPCHLPDLTDTPPPNGICTPIDLFIYLIPKSEHFPIHKYNPRSGPASLRPCQNFATS